MVPPMSQAYATAVTMDEPAGAGLGDGPTLVVLALPHLPHWRARGAVRLSRPPHQAAKWGRRHDRFRHMALWPTDHAFNSGAFDHSAAAGGDLADPSRDA